MTKGRHVGFPLLLWLVGWQSCTASTPSNEQRGNTTTSPSNVEAVYVINLNRRADRLAEFYRRYPFSEEGVTRFAAVDGRELAAGDSRLGLFAVNKWGTTEWPTGLVGATLSHYEVWRKVLRDPTIKRALVFEDDVRFSDSFADEWNTHISPLLPSSAFDVLYVGPTEGEVHAAPEFPATHLSGLCGVLSAMQCHACWARGEQLLEWAEYPRGGVDRSIDCWMLDAVPLLDVWATWDLVCHSVPGEHVGSDRPPHGHQYS